MPFSESCNYHYTGLSPALPKGWVYFVFPAALSQCVLQTAFVAQKTNKRTPSGTYLPAHSHAQPAWALHFPLHQHFQVLPETSVKNYTCVLSEMTR